MRKRILALAMLSAASIFAQDPSPSALIARPTPQWDQLKQYLVLTDAQMTTLEQVRQNRTNQEQAIYQQISEKQRQMYALLQQGSNDAATIGRLMVESNNLQRQLPLKGDTYRTEVLAVLTPAQKAKLPALIEAMRLQSAAWQAVDLNMIDNPNVPDYRILPAPVDLITGIEPVKGSDAVANVR
ncbi:MAG TPA: periplasmic heavy metal sensor [Bryobacteraceae bacterium]|nr:periplasmic heavy metal sensor [Bryobacteraceae bacterium]